MSLANLSLAIFLILFAIVTFGWVDVSNVLVGVFALIAGVLFLLAELSVYPTRKA